MVGPSVSSPLSISSICMQLNSAAERFQKNSVTSYVNATINLSIEILKLKQDLAKNHDHYSIVKSVYPLLDKVRLPEYTMDVKLDMIQNVVNSLRKISDSSSSSSSAV